MEGKKSYPHYRGDNNYDGLNPLDGSPMYPNKAELLEKRREHIMQAIDSIFTNKKDEVLKAGMRGILKLIREELKEKAGVTFKSLDDIEEEIKFNEEYNETAIMACLCEKVGFKSEDGGIYIDLEKAIHAFIE